MTFNRFLTEAVIEPASLPLTPEIRLNLLSHAYLQHPLTAEERQLFMAEPLFWAFCWSSGQVLARRLRDFREGIRGLKVLDFGSGSGIVAIAAALYGAGKVIALDTDPLAREAIRANADLNQVTIGTAPDLHSLKGDFDLVLAADVLYERNNFALLDIFTELAPRVLVADSRINELPAPYGKIGAGTAPTFPDLAEPEEFHSACIFANDKSCLY